MKDGRVGILLSDLIHLPFSCASNSGNVRQVSRPETPKKRYFTLKERSHKNSYVLTGKLAPKEEAWKSLQWAVNFQTSWNFVIKKELHCRTLDSILIYEKEWIWNFLCTQHFFFCSFVCYLILPGALSPCSSPRVSRSPCRPASLRPRRWRVKVLAFTSSQARLVFPPLDASNSGDFRQV